MVFITRLELTEEENDFYRRILYRVTSDKVFGQPFLKRAFYRLIPVSVMGSQTMSVDEFWRVYIDFGEMMRRGVEYAAGILNHEIWHLLRTHHERSAKLPPAPAGYNKKLLWNIAGDLEINDDIAPLLPHVLIKPGQSTFKDYPENLTMEKNYDLILNDLPNVAENFPIEYKDRPQQQNDEPQSEEDKSDTSQSDNEGASSDESSGEENNEGKDADSSAENDADSSTEESSEDKDSSNSSESDTDDSASKEEGDSESESDSSSESDGSAEEDGSSGDADSESDSNDGVSGSSGAGGGSQKPPAFPSNHRKQPQDAWGGGSNTGESSGSNSDASSSESSSGSSEGGASGTSKGGDNEISDEPYDFWKNPQCGSAAGNEQEYELPEEATENMTDLEEEVLLYKVAKDVETYAKEEFASSRSVGSERSGMFNKISEWANQKLKAKPVPWKQEFRGHFRARYGQVAGKLIYVRNRPSRRQPIPEIMYPALRSPKPTIGLAIDVSGSNVHNLHLILVEVMNIMKAAGVRGRDVKAFAVDVAASVEKYVNDPMTLLDDLPSGGGTRMKPGYKRLAELGQDISILITDGYVDDYPKTQPKGKKRTHFITCIVASDRDDDLQKRLDKAKKHVGEWSVVIPLIALEKTSAL